MRILIASSDELFIRTTTSAARLQGFHAECEVLGDAREAAEWLLRDRFDACIMTTPSEEAEHIFDALHVLATGESRTGIIAISAGTDDIRTRLIDAGATYAFTWPMHRDVVWAYLRAMRRRTLSVKPGCVCTIGAFHIDTREKRVRVHGELVKLTRSEYRLLEVLFGNRDNIVTRQMLYQELFAEESDANRENVVSVHVSAIRRKLASQADVRISTIRGYGLMLTCRTEAEKAG